MKLPKQIATKAFFNMLGVARESCFIFIFCLGYYNDSLFLAHFLSSAVFFNN